MKVRKVIIVFIAILLIVGTALSVSLNKHRKAYLVTSAENPLEGYWSKTSTVETAYVNNTPTAAIYYFEMNVDSANAAAATIDVPLWKHWGTIGTVHGEFTVDGLNGDFTQNNDSIHVHFKIQGLNAAGKTIDIATLTDSSNDKSVYDSVAYTFDKEVDLTVEKDYWERLRLYAIQSLTDSTNTDTLDLDVTITLPYSTSYLRSPYYLNEEKYT